MLVKCPCSNILAIERSNQDPVRLTIRCPSCDRVLAVDWPGPSARQVWAASESPDMEEDSGMDEITEAWTAETTLDEIEDPGKRAGYNYYGANMRVTRTCHLMVQPMLVPAEEAPTKCLGITGNMGGTRGAQKHRGRGNCLKAPSIWGRPPRHWIGGATHV